MRFLQLIKSLPRPGTIVLLFIAAFHHKPAAQTIQLTNANMKVDVDPATFRIDMFGDGKNKYTISSPLPSEKITALSRDADQVSWTFPQKGINVSIVLKENFLDVQITTDKSFSFTWPVVKTKANAFTIPFYQGKYIPAQDTRWIKQLTSHSPFSGSQDLSMQFFAVNFNDNALVYVIKNMFNNELSFNDNAGTLGLQFNHEFTTTVTKKQYGFQIYLVPNNIVAIAKTYKKYVEETSGIVTLEEKAQRNPNIRKLYGAPHIYIWNTECITAADITDWKKFKQAFLKQVASPELTPAKYILKQFADKESGKEFLSQFNDFKKDAYVTKYHQQLLTRSLNEILGDASFYNPSSWKSITLNKEAQRFLAKGVNALTATELYSLNKQVLNDAYPGIMRPLQDWGGTPVSMIDEMQQAGIKKAWLGMNDWTCGEMHPAFVHKAVAAGYLAGPYDSYHSMHEPGKERWNTAKFDDTTLYTHAFVMKKNGKPIGGFLGEGRKLNPTLSMPAVEHRVSNIMRNTGSEFNSWFIDCDATGEIYDDYTASRMTSEQQDIAARLKRMAWIRDTYKLVIGSEVGNDFAANTIAYAHGMTTPVIEWGDPDMRKNKDSEYYTGSYFSNAGGIPGRYVLQAPLKEAYIYIYLDNRFNVPLFQLVYNDAVITSHHWEWGSLKIAGQMSNTSLKEILYNVPPLYHLDGAYWKLHKDIISKQVKAFSAVHERAVTQPMENFEWLSADRLVQKTRFGNKIEVVANFGNNPFTYQRQVIAAHTLLILDLSTGKSTLYTP